MGLCGLPDLALGGVVTNNREPIRDLLTALLRQRGDTQTFADDESLLISGRLDSIHVLEIAEALEVRYGVDFRSIEFDPIRVSSVDGLLSVIADRDRGKS